jgi:hypothetical protein
MKFKVIITLAVGILSLIGCSSKTGGADYNTVVSFSKGEKITFPDFVLEYRDERVVDKFFPNGNSVKMKFHDFEANNGGERVIVSWSSGTGDIAPSPFEIGGNKYELELAISEKLSKNLAENELVIVKK